MLVNCLGHSADSPESEQYGLLAGVHVLNAVALIPECASISTTDGLPLPPLTIGHLRWGDDGCGGPSNCNAIWKCPYRYRSSHGVGGGVDDRNSVAASICHIDEGSSRIHGSTPRRTPNKHRSSYAVGGSIDDRNSTCVKICHVSESPSWIHGNTQGKCPHRHNRCLWRWLMC